jgi:hypothetical protein
MLAQVNVQTPGSNIPDGVEPSLLGGRQGEAIVAELHGKWYSAALNGKLFIGSTAAAGTTIPISSATAATFALYNPASSGKNIELARYTLSPNNATLVVSAVQLGIATGIATPAGTALTPRSALLGNSATPQGLLYSAATIVATTSFYHMFGVSATAGLAGPLLHDFDGSVLLAPGSLVHVTGTAAQSQAHAQTFVWAEWPIVS